MAIDKSKWDKNIKVSQKTIDEIKKMGMAKALKTVSGATAASKNLGDASAKEWAEGVKRLYTAERVNAAIKSSKPKPVMTGPKSANTPVYKGPNKPKGAYTKGSTKSQPKSEGLTPQKVVRTVGGAALTAATVLATRGKIRNPSALGKASATLLSKAKAAPKTAPATVKAGAKGSFGPTTKTLAKGKLGTPSEYATRAAQFGGPTNITIKKTAKKAAPKKGKK